MKCRFTGIVMLMFVLCIFPDQAKADIIYKFIKMTCDASTHDAIIESFYDWNESGRDKIRNHDENTYYLDDIALIESKNDKPRRINCNLETDQSISFSAYKGATPKRDSLKLFLNEKSPRWAHFSLENEWSLEIKPTGNEEFTIKYCVSDSPGNEKKTCGLSHVIKSKLKEKSLLENVINSGGDKK